MSNSPDTQPPHLEDIIRDEVYASEHLAQYYPLYEDKLRKNHKRAFWLSVGLAVIAGACLMTSLLLPSHYQGWATGTNVTGLVSTIASIISAILAYHGEDRKNIALAAIAASRWRYLAGQWRMLWVEARMENGRDLFAEWRHLTEEQRVVILETESGPADEELSQKAFDNAKAYLEYFKASDPKPN